MEKAPTCRGLSCFRQWCLYHLDTQIRPIYLPFFRMASPQRWFRSTGYATIAAYRPAKKLLRISGRIWVSRWYYPRALDSSRQKSRSCLRKSRKSRM